MDEFDDIGKIKSDNHQQKFKETSEKYDEMLDKIVPIHVHRGDNSTVNRLLGYTDAMMATCATFLVLPLRNLKELDEGDTLAEFLYKQRLEFIVFFVGFLIVCTIWESINTRCIVIKRLDDILVLFSLIQMMATSVLPFSLSLQGHFPKEDVAVIITTVTLVIVEIMELCIVIYAFSKPRLLHITVRQWKPREQKGFQLIMAMKPIMNIALMLISGLCTLIDYRVSLMLISLLILGPIVRKLVFYLRRHISKIEANERCNFFRYYTKGNISKERVEAFSDAAVAIIACVLILDITVEEFPKADDVAHHGLVAVLDHMKVEFFAFFGTFGMVSLVWYVNHTILHLFHTINIVVLYLQKIFLAFLCFTPLVNAMLQRFSGGGDYNAAVAYQVGSVIGFVAGVCNLSMLLWGYYKDNKFVHLWATKAHMKINRKEHTYVFLKTCIIPFWCLCSLVSSFGEGTTMRYLFVISYILCYLSFVVLKLMFRDTKAKKFRCSFNEMTCETEKENFGYEGDAEITSVSRNGTSVYLKEKTKHGDDEMHMEKSSNGMMVKENSEQQIDNTYM